MQPRCANSSQPTCRTIFAPVLHPYLSRTLHTSLLEHFGTQTGDRHQMSPDQNVWRGDKGSSKYSELTELTGIPAVPRRNWCNRCIDPLSIAALRGTKAPRHQGTKAPRHQGTKAGASFPGLQHLLHQLFGQCLEALGSDRFRLSLSSTWTASGPVHKRL